MPIFTVLYHNTSAPREQHVQPHIDFLTALRTRGIVVANGRLLEGPAGPGGLVLLVADSRAGAERILAEDPYLLHDLSRVDIYEWDAKWTEPFNPHEAPVAEISSSELRRRLAGGTPPVLVDVREDDEVVSGMIPGALHIRLGELGDRLAEIPEGETVFICRGGGRSTKAVRLFAAAGRGDALNATGGMTAWAALPPA